MKAACRQIDAPREEGGGSGHAFGQLIAYLHSLLVNGSCPQERFHAIFLDAERSYLDDCEIGRGHAAHLPVRLRELFARALALGARCLIVAHNHPSGDCRPSACDIAATARLVEIAAALDIEVLDHLIFARERVYSMRAGGKL